MGRTTTPEQRRGKFRLTMTQCSWCGARYKGLFIGVLFGALLQCREARTKATGGCIEHKMDEYSVN